VLRDFSPFGVDMTAGVSVAAAYVDNDAFADVVVGSGPGAPTTVRVFSGATGELLAAPLGEFAPFGAADTAGVSVAASNDPPTSLMLFSKSWTWGNNGEATVTATVTQQGDGRFKWNYHLLNNSFVFGAGDSWGYGYFTVSAPDLDAVSDIGSSNGASSWTGDFLGTGNVTWNFGSEENPGITPGQSADFWFYTPPRPIVDTSGGAFDPEVATCSGGLAVGPGKMPTISTAYDTKLIPVNANDDNGSPWKSKDLPFIPTTRDFDATNLPVDDEELVRVVVTIGGGYAGTLSVSDSVTDCTPGWARVAFWADRKKQAAFSSKAIAAGTDPTTVTFYVEGVHESEDAADTVDIDVWFTTTNAPQLSVWATDTVRVAPFINSFTATIPTPSVSFADQGPPITGLEGLMAGAPAAGGAWTPGIVFKGDVTNGPLEIKDTADMRNVVNGANGSAAGGVFVAGSGLANQNYLPNVGSGFTYPGLDTLDPNDPTDGGALFTSNPVPPDRVTFRSEDSPSTGWPANSDKLDKMDVKYQIREYLVAVYDDDSIYPIAYWDWNVNFYATTNVAGSGVSVINAASKVSTEGGWVPSNADPLKTAGPIFNGNTGWR
jgi:hypothetical protein